MSFGYTGIDELLVLNKIAVVSQGFLNKIEVVSQGGSSSSGVFIWKPFFLSGFSFGNLSFFLSFFLSWVLTEYVPLAPVALALTHSFSLSL